MLWRNALFMCDIVVLCVFTLKTEPFAGYEVQVSEMLLL